MFRRDFGALEHQSVPFKNVVELKCRSLLSGEGPREALVRRNGDRCRFIRPNTAWIGRQ